MEYSSKSRRKLFIMNVRRLSDLNENDRQPESARRLGPSQNRQQRQGEEENPMPWGGMDFAITPEQLQLAEEKKVLLVSGSRKLKNPRQENYWDMLMNTFCPTWSCLSLTMFLCMVILVMFVVMAAYGIDRADPNADLLQLSRDTLLTFGALFGPNVHDGQVWRLIAAIFIHIDFIHFLGNLFSTFILVSRIQYTYGVVRTLIAFLVCGIAGGIFSLATDSSNFSTTIKAGASTSLYGMIGMILGYIIINWRGLRLIGSALRCNILCMFFFMLLFVLIFTPGTSNVVGSVDHLGHLGGFLAGVWISAIGDPLLPQSRQRNIRIVFFVMLVGQLLGTFLGFYLSH